VAIEAVLAPGHWWH